MGRSYTPGAVATSSVSAASSDAASDAGRGVPPAARSATKTLGGGGGGAHVTRLWQSHAPDVTAASGVSAKRPSPRKKHMPSHAAPKGPAGS